MEYYITTKINQFGEYQSTVSNNRIEKVLSVSETDRLVPEELQQESLDYSVKIENRFGKFLSGETTRLNKKVIVLN